MPQKAKVEAEYPCVVIGLDPGGTSGVAVFGLTATTVEYLEHFQWGDQDIVWRQVQALYHKWEDKGFKVYFVSEAFDKRPGIVNPDFSPKYINRDLVNNCPEIDIHWQIPTQMNLVKKAHEGRPDALKRFGWYTVGNRHANDAARHAIIFMVESLRHEPVVLKGWPRK